MVNDVIDHEFLDRIIRCTDTHGRSDVKFKNSLVKVYGDKSIPFSEKGQSLIRGFLALKIYLGFMGVKDMHEAWSQKDPLKAYPELPKVMSFRLFNGLKKHFRVSITEELQDRDSEAYHPLQNVGS